MKSNRSIHWCLMLFLMFQACNAHASLHPGNSVYPSDGAEWIAQLIVPTEVPTAPVNPVPPDTTEPVAPPRQGTPATVEEELVGEWKGMWTNRNRAMPFTLRIRLAGSDIVAEGKAETWSLTEHFEGVLSGNTLTLTGTKVTPAPAPDKRYSLDVLTLTMSQDAQTLDGAWVDQENSRGLVSVQQLNPDGAGSAPGGPWMDLVADANEAIEAATRTGSTKTFLSRAISNRSKRWGEAARNGVPEAHWLIGCCYENGIGVPAPDLRAAFQSYTRAAEKNYGPALNDMGRCYARGSGCEKDMIRAVQYYKRAAEKVRAGAWYNLGACYEQGVGGLPKDQMKAAQCYARAKALGYKLAEKALAQAMVATPETARIDTLVGTTWRIGEFTVSFRDTTTVTLKGGALAAIAPDGLDAIYTLDNGRLQITAMGLTKEGTFDGTDLVLDGSTGLRQP